MADDPKPMKYRALKKAVRTKGMQPGEDAVLKRIEANRDVSRSEAIAIAKRRTAKGLNTGRIKGPRGAGPNARKNAGTKPQRTSKPKDPAKGKGTNDPTPKGEAEVTFFPKPKPDLAIPRNLMPKPTPRKPTRMTSGGAGASKRGM